MVNQGELRNFFYAESYHSAFDEEDEYKHLTPSERKAREANYITKNRILRRVIKHAEAQDPFISVTQRIMNVKMSDVGKDYTYDQLANDMTYEEFVEVENRYLYLEDIKRAAEEDAERIRQQEERKNNF